MKMNIKFLIKQLILAVFITHMAISLPGWTQIEKPWRAQASKSSFVQKLHLVSNLINHSLKLYKYVFVLHTLATSFFPSKTAVKPEDKKVSQKEKDEKEKEKSWIEQIRELCDTGNTAAECASESCSAFEKLVETGSHLIGIKKNNEKK